MSQSVTVKIEHGEHVAIYWGSDELVYWDRQEWVDDPDVTTAIANAIYVALTDGPRALLELIGYVEEV